MDHFHADSNFNADINNKKCKNFSEGTPWSKEKLPANSGRMRPNFFVAVQVSNPRVQENIRRVQRHILQQDVTLKECMIPISTLHITLMVIFVSDALEHERALKALHKVNDECREEMCRDPLQLEFTGLGNFRDKVLYAKLKKDQEYARLCALEESVKRHFAEVNIFSTDPRPFNPHLTIAKITSSMMEQNAWKKINPNLYASLRNKFIGFQTIAGIQLLSMHGNDDHTYYAGDNLLFRSRSESCDGRLETPGVSSRQRQIPDCSPVISWLNEPDIK